MRCKKFRFWLASKILGGAVIEDNAEATERKRQEWIKDQLDKGGSVVLEYEVNTVH